MTQAAQAVLAIHGGAGAIARAEASDEVRAAYETALAGILTNAGRILEQGGSALDAVTEAVRLLEECPLFNAGHGAVLTSAATHELDAAIMDGRNLKSGAVAGLKTVRNPVLAARAVMEHSQHVMFVAEGAEAFAQAQGLERVAPDFFSTPLRREQLERVQRAESGQTALDHDTGSNGASGGVPLSLPADRQKDAPLDEDRKLGTVGAVALDAHGNLAAATSTGGMTNKQPGRVGDSPIIGAGCYANNRTCAVSTTGTGEMFIRMVVAHDISARMEYAGASLEEAAHTVVHEKLPQIDGRGGLVAIDAQGNVAMPFNTEGMYRGFIRAGQAPVVAIYA
ncbi:isoaspartyl peptidase/L-asparaginase family protein [Paraburkholderia sacchari]|uniref:isoaspartyl peptidase/L-asparaginase family protein n=1 Tax=Paraburkholderia sacchari TaxID=159450 RepID=UPI000543BDFE|nr:isoaspartyl peptidase/L-asparaginase [Paraburkholderia sacchari]NLP60657.1 isoaspartyl peptidase/L-asparaginase [Paraburkholderia sacchari]